MSRELRRIEDDDLPQGTILETKDGSRLLCPHCEYAGPDFSAVWTEEYAAPIEWAIADGVANLYATVTSSERVEDSTGPTYYRCGRCFEDFSLNEEDQPEEI